MTLLRITRLLRIIRQYLPIPSLLSNCSCKRPFNLGRCLALLVFVVTLSYLIPTVYQLHERSKIPFHDNTLRERRELNVSGNAKHTTNLTSNLLIPTSQIHNRTSKYIKKWTLKPKFSEESRNVTLSINIEYSIDKPVNVHRNQDDEQDIPPLSITINYGQALPPKHTQTWSLKSDSLVESKVLESSKVDDADTPGHVNNPHDHQNPTVKHSPIVKHIPFVNKTWPLTSKPNSLVANNKIYYNRNKAPVHFTTWMKTSQSFCGGSFVGYNHDIARLENVRVDPTLAIGSRGGEDFRKLFFQSEKKEFFVYKKGFIKIVCDAVPPYYFGREKIGGCHVASCHLDRWLQSMEVQQIPFESTTTIQQYYIAVTRYAYVNMHHTLTDWYNAFLIMNFFNLTREKTNILIVDGHPWGNFDSVWNDLFNSTLRLGHLTKPVIFRSLVFSWQGYNSPINPNNEHKYTEMPLFEEFREFLLDTYRLPVKKTLDCSSLTVTLIWRRDNYVVHPRNPSGNVHRKVKNEDEIISALRQSYPNYKIRGVLLDNMSMAEQMRSFLQSDIVIGMHGAGLTHTAVMPSHGALIELAPTYFKGSLHFKMICKWRNLIYKKWWNRDPALEHDNHYTTIPPKIILDFVNESRAEMCTKQLIQQRKSATRKR